MCLSQKRCEGVNECEYVRHMRAQDNNCLRLLEKGEFPELCFKLGGLVQARSN